MSLHLFIRSIVCIAFCGLVFITLPFLVTLDESRRLLHLSMCVMFGVCLDQTAHAQLYDNVR